MLSTENFSRAVEIWEDLSKDKTDWAAWKKLYKANYRKAKLKRQAIECQDRFGAAHGALSQAPQSQANSPNSLAADLDKYSDALAVAANTEKGVLEELVKSNASLTTTNA